MLSALKTKRARVGLGLLVLLAFTGAAVAYFSSSGQGSGTASVGSSSQLAITGTINAPGGLMPGGAAAGVTFSVNNPSGGNEYVRTVSLTGVKAYTSDPSTGGTQIPVGTGSGQCDTSQFQMTAVGENTPVPAGTSSLPNNGSLAFKDSGANQDGCQGAFLVASFSSN